MTTMRLFARTQRYAANLLLVMLCALGAAPAFAVETYVVVLRPGTKPDPDLSAFHATTIAMWGSTRYVVQMAPEDAAALRGEDRVRYVQHLVPPGAHASTPPRVGTLSLFAPPAVDAPLPDWSTGTYRYDGSGDISATADDSAHRTHRYLYDLLGRLSIAGIERSTDAPGTYQSSFTYSYDPYGNRISRTDGHITIGTPVNSLSNRLNDPQYDYNAVGDVIRDPFRTYAYDALHMLRDTAVGANAETYDIYTADDERLAQCNGEKCNWTIRGPDQKVRREYESPKLETGAAPQYWLWVEDYVYRGGQLLSAVREEREGGQMAFHLDHLGTPRLITGSGGQQLASLEYEPFGEEVTDDSYEVRHLNFERAEPMRFTGHQRDFMAGTGQQNADYIDYMHARYYRPVQGRFSTVDADNFWQAPNDDTAGQEKLRSRLKKPQVWNRYGYASNNPVNAIDPDGRETYVITTFDYGIGSHSAVLVSRNGENLLFDPAGTFVPASIKEEGGTRGSGDMFEGKDANLKSYVDYQKSTGSDVKVLKFNTTQKEEAVIKARIEQQPGIAPGSCAVATSTVISGVGPFKEVKPMRWPGRLYAKLKSVLAK